MVGYLEKNYNNIFCNYQCIQICTCQHREGETFTFVNIFFENSEQFLASLILTQDSQMYIEILFHFNNAVDEYRLLVRKFHSHGPNTNLLITYLRK